MYIKKHQDTYVRYNKTPFKEDECYHKELDDMSEEELETFGIYRVVVLKKPKYNKVTQRMSDAGITLEDGVYYQNWDIIDLSEEEINKNIISSTDKALGRRHLMLSDTDWYVLRQLETGVDVPREVKEYRQVLRDVTRNKEWPFLEEADWPVLEPKYCDIGDL